MNHAQHKFLTTVIVIVMMFIGVFIAAQFKEINLDAMNLVLLLVNSLLLLITFGVLLHINENLPTSKKRVDRK